MLNPITRVQATYTQHKTKFVFGAGIATGIAGAIVLRRNPSVHIIAPIPTQILQHLIDKPEDAASYIEPKTRHAITLINDSILKP